MLRARGEAHDSGMHTSRIAIIAAATTVAAWIAKDIAIGVAGGLGRSPLEAPLFYLGFAASIVAVVALALHLTRSRRPVVRVGAVLGAIVGMIVFVVAVNLALAPFIPPAPHWVWGEVNLWITAAVLLIATLLVRIAGTRSQPRVRRV